MSKCEIDFDGTKRYLNDKGEYHREGGPAYESSIGTVYWYINNKIHREDGPAIVDPNGYKAWYINGKLHREDGHALEYYNGEKHWYYHGKRISCKSQEEFLRLIKMKVFW